MGLQRMSQFPVDHDLIFVATTDPGDLQIRGLYQFGNDLLNHAFGDSYQKSDFTQRNFRVADRAV